MMIKFRVSFWGLSFWLLMPLVSATNVIAPPTSAPQPFKLLIVDSYHPAYLWSQETHRGLGQRLLEIGWLQDIKQIEKIVTGQPFHTPKAQFKFAWMNTKQQYKLPDIARQTNQILQQIKTWQPDLVFLGDDNAANYIGSQLLDQAIPVVFWGVNGSPLKYALLDSEKKPGHNITGVYQQGYYGQTLQFLLEINPSLSTFAVLSDNSVISRAKTKKIKWLAHHKKLPLKLRQIVSTNDFGTWKKAALQMASQVDAVFLLNYQALHDDQNRSSNEGQAAHWFAHNIRLPNCSDEKQFVQTGVLLTVDDSGFLQGYAAGNLSYKILHEKKSPAILKAVTPPPGPRVLNKWRLKYLNLTIPPGTKIDQIINQPPVPGTN